MKLFRFLKRILRLNVSSRKQISDLSGRILSLEQALDIHMQREERFTQIFITNVQAIDEKITKINERLSHAD